MRYTILKFTPTNKKFTIQNKKKPKQAILCIYWNLCLLLLSINLYPAKKSKEIQTNKCLAKFMPTSYKQNSLKSKIVYTLQTKHPKHFTLYTLFDIYIDLLLLSGWKWRGMSSGRGGSTVEWRSWCAAHGARPLAWVAGTKAVKKFRWWFLKSDEVGAAQWNVSWAALRQP